MQQHHEKEKLQSEIIAWITGYDISAGDYIKKKVNQPLDPNWRLADFLAETKEGHNALWIAAQSGETEKFLYLYDMIKKNNPREGRFVLFKLDKSGRSILHAASCCPNNKLIMETILKEVKTTLNPFHEDYMPFHDFLNIQEKEFGKTALHMAAHYESWDNMVTILNYDANPFIKDEFGAAPFDYIKGKKPCFISKFMQFLEFAKYRGKDRKIKEYKVDLVKEMQERREMMVRNASYHRKEIVDYYKEAIAKFNLIDQSETIEAKNNAVTKYQKAFEIYYQSCEEWRQQLVDYNKYYETFKPLIKEIPAKKSFFSQYTFSGFFNGLRKADDYDHASFLKKMKEQDEKLKAEITKLQTPSKSLNPFKMCFASARR